MRAWLLIAATAQVAGAHSMTDKIHELVQLLSQDVGVAEISARIGPVIKDKAPPASLDLRPTLKGASRAHLSRYPGGEPLALDLELQPAARPTVAALREQLGEYKATVRFEQPTSLSFQTPPGTHWKIVLIAEVDSRGGEVKDSDHVVSVTLRRDRVAPR